MSRSLFNKLIRDCAPFRPMVWLHLFGEPLLHPELISYVRAAKSMGLVVGFSTNASLLDRELSEELLDCGLDRIEFSLDAFTEGTYFAIRGQRNLDQIEAGIEQFIDLKYRKGLASPIISIQFVEQVHNEAELAGFTRKWNRRLRPPDFVKSIELIHWPVPETASRGPSREVRGPCPWTFETLVVHWNGDVVPCPMDAEGYLRIGSALTESLQEIWKGPTATRLRASHEQGNLRMGHLCQTCTERQRPTSKSRYHRQLEYDSETQVDNQECP